MIVVTLLDLLFSKLDCGLLQLTSSLVGLLLDTNDGRLVAKHLMLDTEFPLLVMVLGALDLAKGCHLEKSDC